MIKGFCLLVLVMLVVGLVTEVELKEEGNRRGEVERLIMQLATELANSKVVDAIQTYRELAKIDPHNTRVRREAGTLSGGFGALSDSVGHELGTLIAQATQARLREYQAAAQRAPSDREKEDVTKEAVTWATQTVRERALLLLGSELESRAVHLCRTVLAIGDDPAGADVLQDAWGKFCGIKDNLAKQIVQSGQCSRKEIVQVLVQCLKQQEVIEGLLEAGASPAVENAYGFTVFHHLAALGDVQLFESVMKPMKDAFGENDSIAEAFFTRLLSSTTISGNTPYHIAKIRGNEDIAEKILESSPLTDLKPLTDIFGRTADDLVLTELHNRNINNNLHTDKSMFADSLPEVEVERRKLAKQLSDQWTEEVQDIKSVGIMPAPDMRDFVEKFLSAERPAIIRATGNSAVQRLQRRWGLKQLKQFKGSIYVEAGRVPFAPGFGMDVLNLTLADYLDSEILNIEEVTKNNEEGTFDKEESDGNDHNKIPRYIFESLVGDSPLLADTALVEGLLLPTDSIQITSTQFYVGPPNSGAPPHTHRAAWNLLVHGRKHWIILPPKHFVYAKKPIHTWLEEDFSETLQKHAIHFIQQPGDIVYIPDFWSHAVLNLHSSVGVAFEFIWGATEFSLNSDTDSE